MLGKRLKRRASTQFTKFDISVPKAKRRKSQSSVTQDKDIRGIVLDNSPQYKYADCSNGNTFTDTHEATGTSCSLKSTQCPASPALDDKRSSALDVYRQMEFKCSADELTSSTPASNVKRSSIVNDIGPSSYRPVEIKASSHSYRALPSKLCMAIHSRLRRGVKTWND